MNIRTLYTRQQNRFINVTWVQIRVGKCITVYKRIGTQKATTQYLKLTLGRFSLQNNSFSAFLGFKRLRSLRSISPAVENWEVFNSQIHVLVTLGLKDLALPLCDLDLSLGQCQINDPSGLGAIMYNCYYHNLSNASTLCIADIVQHNEQH